MNGQVRHLRKKAVLASFKSLAYHSLTFASKIAQVKEMMRSRKFADRQTLSNPSKCIALNKILEREVRAIERSDLGCIWIYAHPIEAVALQYYLYATVEEFRSCIRPIRICCIVGDNCPNRCILSLVRSRISDAINIYLQAYKYKPIYKEPVDLIIASPKQFCITCTESDRKYKKRWIHPDEEFILFPTCKHLLCRDCFENWAIQIFGGDNEKLWVFSLKLCSLITSLWLAGNLVATQTDA